MYVSNRKTEPNEIDDLGSSIARVVNGGNYAASFQCDELGDVESVGDAVAAVNRLYPESKLRPDELEAVRSWAPAWHEIVECIQYGVAKNDGDEPNRRPLTAEAIDQLNKLQGQLKELLDAKVSNEATICRFSAGREVVLDDYPVFWSYRLIVLNPAGGSLLLHGSSSD
jgi:hypothetical protein